jgi:threonine/homoserine/homoserine lactone efflux protein
VQLEIWLAFCFIAFIAASIPGPAILLVATHSLQFGVLRSLITALGNISGLFIMSGCSILGLTALVALSSTVFTVIKVVGALYLLYLGIKVWRSGVQLNNIESNSKSINQLKFKAWRLYLQGLLISLTNPKAIIFTSALFPQFIKVNEPLALQFIILVLTLMMCSFTCLFLYSLLSQKLKAGSQKYISNKLLGRIFGTTFIGAGGVLAVSVRS